MNSWDLFCLGLKGRTKLDITMVTKEQLTPIRAANHRVRISLRGSLFFVLPFFGRGVNFMRSRSQGSMEAEVPPMGEGACIVPEP